MNDVDLKVKAETDAARALLNAADEAGRSLTADEQSKADAHVKEAKRLRETDRVKRGDAAVRAAIAGLGDAADVPTWARKRSATEWGTKTAERMSTAQSSADGRKAVVSGQYEVTSPLQPGIDRLPDYPTRLLDLLVNRKPLASGNQFEYLRQNVRTHAAAPVADGALKPTSVYSFLEEEDRVRVIAHMSEPVPNRLAADITGLTDFLESELAEGLARAVEEQVVSGDGLGENMTGLLNTSGTLAQAWSTDLLTTLRKASTALEVNGEVPTAWGIHPSDVEVLDLLSGDSARMYAFNGPSQQLSQSAPVWSIPIVKSVAIAPGTAILGDWSRLQLVVREDSQLDIDTSGDLFARNQFRARLEGRYGIAVLRPSAFVEVDLTAV